MKKWLAILAVLVVFVSILSGCGGKTGSDETKEQTSAKSGATTVADDGASSLKLSKMKQATKDAGYNVFDDYQASFFTGVVDGFSVQIIADNKDTRYSIVECKSEADAKSNAKLIDDAGYNVTLINGKFISYVGVDVKDGKGKDILVSILKGDPIKNS